MATHAFTFDEFSDDLLLGVSLVSADFPATYTHGEQEYVYNNWLRSWEMMRPC